MAADTPPTPDEIAAMSQRQKDEGLWDAAELGKLETVKALKAAGADTNWVNPQKPPGRAYQFTSVHIASDKGHTDVVKWLAEKGGAGVQLQPTIIPVPPPPAHPPICFCPVCRHQQEVPVRRDRFATL